MDIQNDNTTEYEIVTYVDENGWMHRKMNPIAKNIEKCEKQKTLEPKLITCQCCGAPLKGNKCEYCGSTYIWK